jgi:fructose-1,6-bisphosphatase/inositol monophosphatase family enzyme
MTIDPEKVADYIRAVAADKITPRFQKLKDHEIDTKSGPTDFVTIADIEAEHELTRILSASLPGSLVVGEEATSRGEVGIETLRGEDGPVWIIDPVDGTSNFASGNPRFGCMVALVQGGQTTHGWIFDIIGDRMAVAEKGAGVAINGAPVRFDDRDAGQPLSTLEGFVARKFLPKSIRPAIDERLEAIKSFKTYACAAHDYLALLEQKRAFSMYTRIKPWDHLPGSLMIEAAGGTTLKWDKTAYEPGDDWGGLINTTTPSLWPVIHDHFVTPIWDDIQAAQKL